MTCIQKLKQSIAAFRKYWEPVPRKLRILLLLTASMLVGFLFYILIDCPAFSMEMHYRRVEKANMVGPAKILDILELENYSYDQLVIADDGDGIIMYGLVVDGDYEDYQPSQLVYRKKQGAVSVYSAPVHYWDDWEYEQAITLPVFVFDNMPSAVRAELDLEITNPYTEGNVTEKYFLTSEREKEGYFQFLIHEEDELALLTTARTLQVLASLSSNQIVPYTADSDTTVPATVRLYDKNDKLLFEETIIIRSLVGEAHVRQQGAVGK